MVEQFIAYIKQEKLLHTGDRVLLAVSGGLDSMVMLRLFQMTGYPFAVAHCNFRLRGAESDGDEQFVRDYCDQQNIQLFLTRFDTREYADQEGISIEMAARNLRYDWFYKLLETENCSLLATAHHQDDLVETFFLNLSRGTGIRGLSGIKVKSDKLIRPMLFADRKWIADFARLHKVGFREDSTNSDTDIKRNYIRHQVLPLLDDFHPSFRKNVVKTVDNLWQTEQLFRQKIDEIRRQIVAKSAWGEEIDIERLKQQVSLRTVLYELLRDKNFQAEQVDDMLNALDAESGRKFYSPTHWLVKDRGKLLVAAQQAEQQALFYIEKDCSSIDFPVNMVFEKMPGSVDFRFSTDPLIADLDFEKLEFPLILRKWKEGEYFQPLGMSGLKKLSDFFIDEKFSLLQKENIWVLASGSRIVWIPGKRLDDRFKITSSTRTVWRISLK